MLHVVVRTGSGVAAAIGDHMAAMPEFDHHLLVSRDETCPIGDHLERRATSVIDLPAGHLAPIRRLRDVSRELAPDVVHAHSSHAGAYVRLALGAQQQARVVYTPHCYAFERTDVAWPVRSAFWLVEAALSFRGAQVAACSPLETTLARSLPGRQQVTYVPNIAPDLDLDGADPSPTMRVSAAGRVSAQKAPWLFAAAARRNREDANPAEWVWIGGGDHDQEAVLRAAGVAVTGWLPRDEAVRCLARSHVYVHTASWESAPMTILEAAAIGVPVVARRTRAMEALGIAPLFDSETGLLELLADFPGGPSADLARRCGEAIRLEHTLHAQARALDIVYGRAQETAHA
ncbi:MAG: glycosyltransferase [Acidimicrobiales bacterium]